MIKVIEFMSKECLTIEEQINSFIEHNDIEVIDIKYQVVLDTHYDIFMSFALLIYKDFNLGIDKLK